MQVCDEILLLSPEETQVYLECMEIKERCSLNAPIEQVWKILAEDYGDVGRWTRVKTSEPLKGGRMRQTVLTFWEDLRHYAQTGAPSKAAA